jgi:hypothetical protein
MARRLARSLWRPPGQQQHEPGRQTVVVENPAAVDEQGNEVSRR